MSNLIFKGEVFIPIDDAKNYLVDKQAVCELNTLYFYYKGFADLYLKLDEPVKTCPDETIFYSDPERVHVDGMVEMDAAAVGYFWRASHDGADFYTQQFYMHTSKVNGKDLFIEPGSYFNSGRKILMSTVIVYVKQSDMDALSKRYGIPKNTCTTETNDAFNEKHPEDESLESDDEMINSDIEEFLKSIVVSYPKAVSKAILSQCFACYKGNTSKIDDIKRIMKKMGVDMITTPGKPSGELMSHIKGAPTFKPKYS